MIVPPINKAQVTGLGISDSPQFAAVNVGHASDTTLGRAAAGVLAVEGINLLKANDSANTRVIGITIDGAGSVITTGTKGYVRLPWNGTINKVTVLLDQSGSIVVDLWKDTYANYPPTDADSITASAPPTVAGATKSEDSTLTGWTTNISTGDVLGFNVDSIATAQRATLEMEVTLT